MESPYRSGNIAYNNVAVNDVARCVDVDEGYMAWTRVKE